MKLTANFLFVLIIGSFLLTACGSAATPVVATTSSYPPPVQQATSNGYPAPGKPAQGDAAAAYPAEGIVLQIVKADGNVISLDFRGLSALAKQKVTLENKEENGFKLSDALSLGGISAVNKVTVSSNSGQLVLTREQVAQAYLDMAANGMIRLMVQGIPQDKWLSGLMESKYNRENRQVTCWFFF